MKSFHIHTKRPAHLPCLINQHPRGNSEMSQCYKIQAYRMFFFFPLSFRFQSDIPRTCLEYFGQTRGHYLYIQVTKSTMTDEVFIPNSFSDCCRPLQWKCRIRLLLICISTEEADSSRRNCLELILHLSLWSYITCLHDHVRVIFYLITCTPCLNL